MDVSTRPAPITGEGTDRKRLHTHSKPNPTPTPGRLHIVQRAHDLGKRRFGDGIRVSIGFIVAGAAFKVGGLVANASGWLVSRRKREVVSFELSH